MSSSPVTWHSPDTGKICIDQTFITETHFQSHFDNEKIDLRCCVRRLYISLTLVQPFVQVFFVLTKLDLILAEFYRFRLC